MNFVKFQLQGLTVGYDAADEEGAAEMSWRWWIAAFAAGLVLEAFIIGPGFADDLYRLVGGTITAGIIIGALLRLCVKVAKAVRVQRSEEPLSRVR